MVVPPPQGEPATLRHDAYTGPERRSASRPWADRPPAGRSGAHASEGESRVTTGGSARISRRRKLAHVAAGIGGWAGFAALWIWQLATHVPESWGLALALVGIWLAGFSVLTPVWVWWNRNIYRRRHRRTTAMVRPVEFTHDSLGRDVIALPEVRLNASRVLVALDRGGTAKRYEVAPFATAPPAAAAPGAEKVPA